MQIIFDNFNKVLAGMVTATVCLALLGVIGLAYADKVDAQQIVTFVLTSVGGLVAAVGAWFTSQRLTEAKAKTEVAELRARVAQMGVPK